MHLSFLAQSEKGIVTYMYISGNRSIFAHFFAKSAACTCMASVLISMGKILKKNFRHIYSDDALQKMHSELHYLWIYKNVLLPLVALVALHMCMVDSN